MGRLMKGTFSSWSVSSHAAMVEEPLFLPRCENAEIGEWGRSPVVASDGEGLVLVV